MYESFWTLTGNPRLLKAKVVGEVAGRVGVERAQALYALVQGLGVVVLNGTTDGGRMRGDLEAAERVRAWAEIEGNRGAWEGWRGEFEEGMMVTGAGIAS